MRHVHQEIRVAAPVKHVFDVACDWQRQPEWNPYMRLANVRGPLDHVGTTFDATLTLLGHDIHSLGVVTEVVAHRLIHVRVTHLAGGTASWTYRFEPAGEATDVSLDIDYELPGILRGVMDLLVYHGALDRATRHMAENFAGVAARVPVLA